MVTRNRKPTPPAPAPEVIPTVRPLGTSARVQAALALNPEMSETDANIVALATELVTMKTQMRTLMEKVGKLESAVTALLKLSLAETPPVAPVAKPVVEPPAVTQQRMNPARENRVRRMNGLAPLTGQQQPRLGKAEPLPFLGNARLIKVFDSFIDAGIHFNKESHDAKLAQPSARYLLDAANTYLDGYQGNDVYLLSVQRYSAETRTVPQLRGVLGKMLTFYKSALARG
jgi:hypothetical protein